MHRNPLTVYDDMCAGLVGGQARHGGDAVDRLAVVVDRQPQSVVASLGDVTEPAQRPRCSVPRHVVVVAVGELQLLREGKRVGDVALSHLERHVGRRIATVGDTTRRRRTVLDENGVASWLDSAVAGHHLADDDQHAVDRS